MSVAEKAKRLADEGAVSEYPHPARLFEVRGDHANYLVVVAGPLVACSCPAKIARCSHAEAAIEFCYAEGERRRELDAALAERKQHDKAQAERLFVRLDR